MAVTAISNLWCHPRILDHGNNQCSRELMDIDPNNKLFWKIYCRPKETNILIVPDKQDSANGTMPCVS